MLVPLSPCMTHDDIHEEAPSHRLGGETERGEAALSRLLMATGVASKLTGDLLPTGVMVGECARDDEREIARCSTCNITLAPFGKICERSSAPRGHHALQMAEAKSG